jgi:hypothetical protein
LQDPLSMIFLAASSRNGSISPSIVLDATFLIYCRYIMRHGKKARKGDSYDI